MVMTVLVDMNNNICVSHDKEYEGIPEKVVFDRESGGLNLVVSYKAHETEIYLGKIAPPKIQEKMLQANEIRVKHLAIDEQLNDVTLPLSICNTSIKNTSRPSPLRMRKEAASG